MNKAFESMHLQYLDEKAKGLIREFNESQNISSLIYAYCIKEYISLKNAILFHNYNYSENEANFIDAFSLNIKGLTLMMKMAKFKGCSLKNIFSINIQKKLTI